MEARLGSFIQHALIEMILHKVEIKLIQQNTVECEKDVVCAGYFDNNPRALFVCAMGIPQRDWVPVFIHEYCHFLQWKDNCKVWINYQKINNDNKVTLDHWIAGDIEMSNETVKKHARVTREVELDCEKRVVELIQRFDLEFNVEEYIRRANADVLYFNIIPSKRQWFSEQSPSNVKQILKIMSNRFLKSYNRTPKKYTQLVDKYCF